MPYTERESFSQGERKSSKLLFKITADANLAKDILGFKNMHKIKADDHNNKSSTISPYNVRALREIIGE
jgi:hypothetical protein